MEKKQAGRILWILILSSLLIRAFLAGYLELGNDEVYYWTYALYPDWSYFDHPPMVGWVINLFTLDLRFDHHFFIRLGAVISGSLATWLIYLIGKKVKNRETGLIAAFLYTASIYFFIICGTFILPDTPQVVFWLMSILFFVNSVVKNEITSRENKYLLLAGLSIGLATLSKYTSAFLWLGALLYIVFYKRNWLKQYQLYVSLMITAVVFLPVILWNIKHDFISFTYQGERIGILKSGLRLDYFATELMGQVFYQNIINFVLVVLMLIAVIRGRNFINKEFLRLFLLTGLPLIMIFLAFSLFRRTLPHWSGPGYLSLLVLTAAYLENAGGRIMKRMVVPLSVQGSMFLLIVILFLGVGQIRGGWFFTDRSESPRDLGRNDVSLDMYGWEQLQKKYSSVQQKHGLAGLPLISHRWFPAAHIDYYIAQPLNTSTLAIGDLENIHEYAFINNKRGGFNKGMDAVFITLSRDYQDPEHHFGDYFNEIIPIDTIAVERCGKHVMNAFVYRLKNLETIPQPFKK